MTPGIALGLVEGFYGRAWSWEERSDMAAFLAANGYTRYLYALKSDAGLRKLWREPYSTAQAVAIRAFSSRLRELGIEFGMGLCPHKLELESPAAADSLICRKVDELILLGASHVSLLFDDVRGDTPDLAQRQLEAARSVRTRWPKLRLSFCPTYYSLDPVLDRLFGARPATYLEELGAGLDAEVEVFWTGERICSKSYAADHLRAVGAVLRRKPLLWDNYPVNDTESMSGFLHLRAFSERPASLAPLLAGHFVNPMLQPTLSRAPILTLAESYDAGAAYDPAAAFGRAVDRAFGPRLGRMIARDHAVFQDQGLGRLESPTLERLRREYLDVDHPAAREVADWLAGAYRVTRAAIEAQQ